jgi:hypothetical protein
MRSDLAALDTPTLTRCLRECAGEERDRQVDFLRYLDAFDAREAWREAGHGSRWQYCLGELHLREGAAGRRIGAMRVLRRFPRLEAPLRDGRLGLTTVVTLRPVLTDGNLDEVVERAAFKTDEETRELVAALSPRPAPQEGIRRLAGPCASPSAPALALAAPVPAPALGLLPLAPSQGGEPAGGDRAPTIAPAVEPEAVPLPAPSPVRAPEPAPRAAPLARPARPAEVEPVTADTWSMRVTLDRQLKADLDALRGLLSHKFPDGNLAAVLGEALRCAIEKHGKRRGAVQPARPRSSAATAPAAPAVPSAEASSVPTPAASAGPGGQPPDAEPPPRVAPPPRAPRPPVPLAVRRAVWERDGGRCTYVSADGRRCGSTWQLEFDHVDPAARGGPSTVENTRLRCKLCRERHKQHYAERLLMPRRRVEGLSRKGSSVADAA